VDTRLYESQSVSGLAHLNTNPNKVNADMIESIETVFAGLRADFAMIFGSGELALA